MEIKIDAGDWPAWIQAIGSIAAIGAAIWISRFEYVRARREKLAERERAEAATCALLAPVLGSLISHFEDIERSLNLCSSPVTEGEFNLMLGLLALDQLEQLLDRFETLPEDQAHHMYAVLTLGRNYRAIINSDRETTERGYVFLFGGATDRELAKTFAAEVAVASRNAAAAIAGEDID